MRTLQENFPEVFSEVANEGCVVTKRRVSDPRLLGFLRAIASEPWPSWYEVSRLVFADWLGDQADEREHQVRDAVPVIPRSNCHITPEAFPQEPDPLAKWPDNYLRDAWIAIQRCRQQIVRLFPKITIARIGFRREYTTRKRLSISPDGWLYRVEVFGCESRGPWIMDLYAEPLIWPWEVKFNGRPKHARAFRTIDEAKEHCRKTVRHQFAKFFVALTEAESGPTA